MFSFLCAALAPRPPSLSSLPTFRSFLPFPRGFHPSLLADVATCAARARIRHVSHITLFLLGDGRTRRAWSRWGSGGGAGDDTRWGKIRRQSPCDQRWIEAGNRLELERGGGNRGCVCERFLGFMEGMMMSVGGGGGGGGRAISKQIRGALSASHTTTRASHRRLPRLSDV